MSTANGLNQMATLNGTTQNDIIKEYLSRGTYAFPPAPSSSLPQVRAASSAGSRKASASAGRSVGSPPSSPADFQAEKRNRESSRA